MNREPILNVQESLALINGETSTVVIQKDRLEEMTMVELKIELTAEEYARLVRVVKYCNDIDENNNEPVKTLDERVKIAVMEDFVESVEQYRIDQEDEDALAHEPSTMVCGIDALVEDALAHEPSHHDRWYLEQIADILGIDHEKTGIAP